LKKVRGIAFDGKHLYIADADAGSVTAYDSAANPVAVFQVEAPMHLLYDGSRWLYVGSETANAVVACDTHHVTAAKTVEVISGDTRIDHTAGLALADSGDGSTVTMFVSSRERRQILSYPLSFSGGAPKWTSRTPNVVLDSNSLADDPEFVTIGSL
jgi:hypothetical protein